MHDQQAVLVDDFINAKNVEFRTKTLSCGNVIPDQLEEQGLVTRTNGL